MNTDKEQSAIEGREEMSPLLFSIGVFIVYAILLGGIYTGYMLIELRKDKKEKEQGKD